MPAICAICCGLPRAPESTIMLIELNGFSARVFSIARLISVLAEVQISTSFWRRSSSVMMPRLNCVSVFSASFSKRSRIERLSGGVFTSSIEIVRPDWAP